MPGGLIVIPTAIERDQLLAASPDLINRPDWLIEVCGFGVIAAAATTSRSIAIHRPDRVILAGIAGSLDDRFTVGSAHWFSRVVCDGIGVIDNGISQNRFVPASQLGWNQIDDDISGAPIGEQIGLHDPSGQDAILLTVCAASANRQTAINRRNRIDGFSSARAVAEDMEGFAVAMACQIAGTPLSIVRGISNRAGDRDHSKWNWEDSFRNVAGLVSQFIER